MDVCAEVGCNSNRAVMRYWQTFKDSAQADNAPDGTCWFLHSLWVDPQASNDPGKRFRENERSHRGLPETWDAVPDGDYLYYYFDGKRERVTDARTIRQNMWRIRCPAKRLSETRPGDNDIEGEEYSPGRAEPEDNT